MAKDGIRVSFRGGAKLDRALTKIGNIKQSKATTIVNQALNAGATQVKKSIANVTPVADKDTTGFSTSSNNTTKGQLKRSLRSGLRKKVNVDRTTFLAGVWYQDTGTGSNDDGWFAKFLMGRSHAPNAFGFKGGHNAHLKKGISKGEKPFKNKVGGSLARKIAAFGQAQINKLG